MKDRFLRLLYLGVVVSCTILFSSCSNRDNITSPDPVPGETVTLSSRDISIHAGKAINEIFNNAIISYMGYHKVIPGNESGYTLNKSRPAAKTNQYEDGYYIWENKFVDAQYPDATSNSLYCKVQFIRSDGTVCRNPRDAASVYSYMQLTGAFGFVNGEPYGDKSVQTLEGIWSELNSVPTYNGSGTYERWWTGLYSSTGNEADERDLTIHYLADISVEQLKLYFSGSVLSATGKIEVSIEDYNAVGTCNQSGIMQITVYKGSEICNTREIDISGRLSQISFYLDMLD